MTTQPFDGAEIREQLLKAVAKVVDLRFNTVQDAAKKLDVPVEQLNVLLKGDILKLRIVTMVHICNAAGLSLQVAVEPNGIVIEEKRHAATA